jgi:hypothetical protein
MNKEIQLGMAKVEAKKLFWEAVQKDYEGKFDEAQKIRDKLILIINKYEINI